MPSSSGTRRLQRITAHVHGTDGEPLWVQLMDATARPAPRFGGCRCTAEKWKFVCTCYPCLEHSGREADFEWTPELVSPPKLETLLATAATARASTPSVSLSPQPTAGKAMPRTHPSLPELSTVESGGVKRLASPDGSILGPMSPAAHQRFGGIATFCRLPTVTEIVAAKPSTRAKLEVRGLRLKEEITGRLTVRAGSVKSEGPETKFEVGKDDGFMYLELTGEDGQPTGVAKIGLWSFPMGTWARRSEALLSPSNEENIVAHVTFEVRLDRILGKDFVDIAVLGVPFDSGCSFRPGARFGAESIRANSRLIRPYLIAGQQRPLLERQVIDAGDVACTPFGVDKAMSQIYEDCKAKLEFARRLVVMGGDHTLSYPAIKAVAEKFGPVVLIHFDSHLDTFPPMYDQDVWHGSPFRKCWEENLLAKDGSTHIGIRASTYSPQDFHDSDAMGIATLTADDVHENGVEACLDVVRKRYLKSNGAPVYLSIDIDVLDPSVAPGTGTPEFGGLLAHQLLHFIRGFQGMPIVGADLVEVAPAYDHAGITAMAGANIILEELALINSCMDTDGFA
mmetsp:Transcript_13548/g.29666  ORF Transcript_13548/g.29666 Transcript_13548/m.29666 type:complete len:567 (+) Transcript_13548:276-1976(+)